HRRILGLKEPRLSHRDAVTANPQTARHSACGVETVRRGDRHQRACGAVADAVLLASVRTVDLNRPPFDGEALAPLHWMTSNERARRTTLAARTCDRPWTITAIEARPERSGRPAPSQAPHVSHVRRLLASSAAGQTISPADSASSAQRTRKVR